MPPKRRIRNGVPPAPLLARPSPTVANDHNSATAFYRAEANGVTSGTSSSSDLVSSVDQQSLTQKQQQQLDKNEWLIGQTKEQLRRECRKRGQKNSGNKTELVFLLNTYRTSRPFSFFPMHGLPSVLFNN